MSYDCLPVAAGDTGRYAGLVVARGPMHVACLTVGTAAFGLTGAIFASAVAFLLTYPLIVRIIRPYGGQDPRHEAGFAARPIAASAVVLWLRWPSVALLFVQ